MNHSECPHPSTKNARAKCRKGVDATTENMNHGTTPRDRDRQCMNCGVEAVTLAGTDILNGMMLFVGDRCAYLIRHSPDLREAR